MKNPGKTQLFTLRSPVMSEKALYAKIPGKINFDRSDLTLGLTEG
jgi:hypothetical protein